MVRIKDIAQRAGVSTTTVSNVIHQNTKKVSPENIQKINQLIDEMGYIQRKGFNVIRNERSGLIAVVANSHKTYEESLLGDPFYGQIIGFIESRLRELGYYMMFYSAPDIDDIFKMIVEWDVDGVIALTFSANNCEKLKHFINKPIVSIDAHEIPSPSTTIQNIGIDNREGGFIMGKHLLSLGYENIFVCAHKDYGNDHLRFEGVQDAWRASDSPNKHKLQLCTIGSTWEYRQNYYKELVRHMPFKYKTAAFFLSDYCAMEAMSYILNSGFSVPKDIGICGFDGIIYGSLWVSPSLTTIRQDIRGKAILAVDELVAQLTNSEYKGINQILPLSLQSRESV